MTSDLHRQQPVRCWLSLAALIAVLFAGCGDSAAQKPDALPVQPQTEQPKQQPPKPQPLPKGMPPGGNKME